MLKMEAELEQCIHKTRNRKGKEKIFSRASSGKYSNKIGFWTSRLQNCERIYF